MPGRVGREQVVDRAGGPAAPVHPQSVDRHRLDSRADARLQRRLLERGLVSRQIAARARPLGLSRLADRLFKEDETRRTRSEEHTSEIQSLMRHSYAVFSLQKKTSL